MPRSRRYSCSNGRITAARAIVRRISPIRPARHAQTLGVMYQSTGTPAAFAALGDAQIETRIVDEDDQPDATALHASTQSAQQTQMCRDLTHNARVAHHGVRCHVLEHRRTRRSHARAAHAGDRNPGREPTERLYDRRGVQVAGRLAGDHQHLTQRDIHREGAIIPRARAHSSRRRRGKCSTSGYELELLARTLHRARNDELRAEEQPVRALELADDGRIEVRCA